MNLNEDCLLSYLQKPDELSCMTDVLKVNNYIMERRFLRKNFLAKSLSLIYTDKDCN